MFHQVATAPTQGQSMVIASRPVTVGVMAAAGYSGRVRSSPDRPTACSLQPRPRARTHLFPGLLRGRFPAIAGHRRGIVGGSRWLSTDSRANVVSAAAPADSSARKQQQQPQMLRLPPELVAAGGLVVADQPEEGKAQLAGLLKERFMPVDIETPGLRILNIDPPIFSAPDFLTAQECDDLVNAALDAEAKQPDAMGQSAVGNASGGKDDGGSIRTSSTLGLTSTKLQQLPFLAPPVEALLTKAQHLLPVVGANLLKSMKDGFKKPNSTVGSWAVEQPQVARYSPGQHFLTHLDAFPAQVVSKKGYQRKATLLVYLNDVRSGGGTYFDLMDMRVQPVKGTALLFFPAFVNGMPDQRLPHTAEDAVDEKWVSQLWVVEGTKLQWPPAGAVAAGRAPKQAKTKAAGGAKAGGSRGKKGPRMAKKKRKDGKK